MKRGLLRREAAREESGDVAILAPPRRGRDRTQARGHQRSRGGDLAPQARGRQVQADERNRKFRKLAFRHGTRPSQHDVIRYLNAALEPVQARGSIGYYARPSRDFRQSRYGVARARLASARRLYDNLLVPRGRERAW